MDTLPKPNPPTKDNPRPKPDLMFLAYLLTSKLTRPELLVLLNSLDPEVLEQATANYYQPY